MLKQFESHVWCILVETKQNVAASAVERRRSFDDLRNTRQGDHSKVVTA